MRLNSSTWSSAVSEWRAPDPLGRKNLTRRSRSIPRALWRNGKVHFFPIYWLMMQSDLGREGIENSGSYRFADHIYRDQPSGRNFLGRWLDGLLLRLPASRAFRERCRRSELALQSAWRRHLVAHPGGAFRILAVPCGLPRDFRNFLRTVGSENPADLTRIEYTGLDLDPQVLALAEDYLQGRGAGRLQFQQGDALERSSFHGPYHCVVSTGLGEFLSDAELARFYQNAVQSLAAGGIFFTSATRAEPFSKTILDAFELETHYRTQADLEKIVAQLDGPDVTYSHDDTGLQTFMKVNKNR